MVLRGQPRTSHPLATPVPPTDRHYPGWHGQVSAWEMWLANAPGTCDSLAQREINSRWTSAGMVTGYGCTPQRLSLCQESPRYSSNTRGGPQHCAEYMRPGLRVLTGHGAVAWPAGLAGAAITRVKASQPFSLHSGGR